MWYFELNSEKIEVYIQKSIKHILEEQNFRSFKKLSLKYVKLKYTCCIKKTKYKKYIKAKQCKLCKKK